MVTVLTMSNERSGRDRGAGPGGRIIQVSAAPAALRRGNGSLGPVRCRRRRQPGPLMALLASRLAVLGPLPRGTVRQTFALRPAFAAIGSFDDGSKRIPRVHPQTAP